MTKVFKNVVSIQMGMLLEGRGCVNYDSKEQKEILYAKGLLQNGIMNDNFLFTKKEFYTEVDENGEKRNTFTHKISPDCLKYNALDKSEDNVNLLLMEDAYYNHKASMVSMLNGFVDLNRNKSNYSRKGGMIVMPAEEVCRVGNNYEVVKRDNLELEFSTACHDGYAIDSDGNVVGGKQTIIMRENIGRTLYCSDLTFIMKDIAFINCDHLTPNLNIETENKLFNEIYVPKVSEYNGSNIKDTLGFYYLKTSQQGKYNSRYGMVISPYGVNNMIMHALSMFSNLEIWRTRGAHLKFVKFLNVVVNFADGTKCNLGDMTYDEIRECMFEMDDMYVKVDEEFEKKIVDAQSKLKSGASKTKKGKKNGKENSAEN